MRKKIVSILFSLFTFLFLIYPLSYGITDLKVIIIFLTVFLVLFKIVGKIKVKIHFKDKYYIFIVFLLAFITRVGIVLCIGEQVTQVSDFQNAFSHSFSLNFTGDYYKVFNHWILFPTIINFIYKIFGESQLVALLFNSVTLVGCSIFIYLLTVQISKNKKYALIASLLYIFWPANILYTLIFTQEHICSLILLIILYCFIRNENNSDLSINIKKIVVFVFIGFMLGLSVFFKNFAPVFIIAIFIYFLLNVFYQSKIKSYIISKTITFFIILLSFFVTKNVTFICIDNLVGERVARNIIPCYLNVGLRDQGVYSKKNYAMYFDALKENNYDYNKTNSLIMSKLFNDKEANLTFELFDNKAKIIFSNDSSRLYWVKESLNIENANKILDKVEQHNNYYFTILVFLMFIGLCNMNKEKNMYLLFINLIFFGSLLLLLLVEAQNRYMYAIQTIMCMSSAFGINYLGKLCKKFKIGG